jgi:hypothetical protein
MKASRATPSSRAGTARSAGRALRRPAERRDAPSRRERSRIRRQALWERRFRWAFWLVALVVFADLLFNLDRIAFRWPF